MLLLAAILSGTCKNEDENCHRTILFTNTSSKDLYIQASGGYPDTLSLRNEFPNPALNADLYEVNSNSKNDRGLWRRDCYELAFGDVIIPSDTLIVYVFDAEVLENVDWTEVVNDYMVLKRYDLSLEDLEDMNWTITYP